MVQIHPELPLQLLIGISVAAPAMWGTTEICFSLPYQRTLSQSPFTLPGPTSHHHTDQLLCASTKVPAVLTQWKPAQTRLGTRQEGRDGFPTRQGEHRTSQISVSGQGRRSLAPADHSLQILMFAVCGADLSQLKTPHNFSFLKFWWKKVFNSHPEFLCFRKLRTTQRVLHRNLY